MCSRWPPGAYSLFIPLVYFYPEFFAGRARRLTISFCEEACGALLSIVGLLFPHEEI
jgi:hypothetical protein